MGIARTTRRRGHRDAKERSNPHWAWNSRRGQGAETTCRGKGDGVVDSRDVDLSGRSPCVSTQSMEHRPRVLHWAGDRQAGGAWPALSTDQGRWCRLGRPEVLRARCLMPDMETTNHRTEHRRWPRVRSIHADSCRCFSSQCGCWRVSDLNGDKQYTVLPLDNAPPYSAPSRI